MRSHQISKTALGVARAVLYLAQDPVLGRVLPTGSPELTRAFLASVSRVFRWDSAGLKRRWYRGYTDFRDRFLLPGASLHVGVRKRWIDDEARRAIADGATQVVVLGAGFDTLAARLAGEFPALTCFEIDHPATQAHKRRALAKHCDPLANLHLVPLDLTRAGVEETLTSEARYDRTAVTFFVAEGVLMYLTEEDVRATLRLVRGASAPGSRFAFTFLAADERGEPVIGYAKSYFRLMLRLAGEPFHWAIAPTELAAFLAQEGLDLIEWTNDPRLLPRYFDDPSIQHRRTLDWEYSALAESRPRGPM